MSDMSYQKIRCAWLFSKSWGVCVWGGGEEDSNFSPPASRSLKRLADYFRCPSCMLYYKLRKFFLGHILYSIMHILIINSSLVPAVNLNKPSSLYGTSGPRVFFTQPANLRLTCVPTLNCHDLFAGWSRRLRRRLRSAWQGNRTGARATSTCRHWTATTVWWWCDTGCLSPVAAPCSEFCTEGSTWPTFLTTWRVSRWQHRQGRDVV